MSERGRSLISVAPAARVPLACGGNVPLDGGESAATATATATAPDPLPTPVRAPVPECAEPTAASQALSTREPQASGPPHLLA